MAVCGSYNEAVCRILKAKLLWLCCLVFKNIASAVKYFSIKLVCFAQNEYAVICPYKNACMISFGVKDTFTLGACRAIEPWQLSSNKVIWLPCRRTLD